MGQKQPVPHILGVLGGMGALASAEFLKSIYESGPLRPEQSSAIVALYSDPTFPDRTEAFLRGEEQELLVRLLDALARLRGLGATRIVLCCMTLHHLLPRLPPAARAGILSLPDVIFDELGKRAERHLLICSSGARALNLFEEHPAWARCRDRIVLPDQDEQSRLHALIYDIKENRGVGTLLSFIESLLGKYRVDSFIAGCSELHVVAKQLCADPARARLCRCLDPFAIVARDWAEGRLPALPPSV